MQLDQGDQGCWATEDKRLMLALPWCGICACECVCVFVCVQASFASHKFDDVFDDAVRAADKLRGSGSLFCPVYFCS